MKTHIKYEEEEPTTKTKAERRKIGNFLKKLRFLSILTPSRH